MSSSNLHCYIITGTELKEKHTLGQDVLFCCIIFSSELKDCQSQAKQIVAITTQGCRGKKKMFVLLLKGPDLLIHLPKNKLSRQKLCRHHTVTITYGCSPHLDLKSHSFFFFFFEVYCSLCMWVFLASLGVLYAAFVPPKPYKCCAIMGTQ